MTNRLINIAAATLLLFVFFMTVFSMKDDSLTMDELAHLPAGYSYLTQQDMRLNPEHPPLIKDLAALPLLFIENIKFPSDSKAWNQDINGQWGFGRDLLFNSNNPIEKMTFWARIPMILILLSLGFLIFKWTKRLFGNKTAVLALFLFSFSPTLLAHGRLVTTDVGAALGIVLATYFFIKFLRFPAIKNIVFAGIFLGLAELTKFTTILLFPFFAVLIVAFTALFATSLKHFFKSLSLCGIRFLAILAIAFLVIGAVYQFQVWNYPAERQTNDIKELLSTHPIQSVGPVLSSMAGNAYLKPYSYYFTGLFLVFQRASFGSTTYFLGEISNQGWKNYFPVVYILKEPLAFNILSVIALLSSILLLFKISGLYKIQKIKGWLKYHFAEFAMLIFIAIYWTVSLESSLNIGARHLLPVLPFTIMLVAAMTTHWMKLYSSKIKYALLGALMIWQAASVAKVFPSFLSYCNELAGKAEKCYLYTVDSNYDWGQDLKRLAKWVDEQNIGKIYVDYFGGGDPKYYLGNKFFEWHGDYSSSDFPKGNYLAISATYLQLGKGKPAPTFNQSSGFYLWLDNYKPVARIGYSIFVYQIK